MYNMNIVNETGEIAYQVTAQVLNGVIAITIIDVVNKGIYSAVHSDTRLHSGMQRINCASVDVRRSSWGDVKSSATETVISVWMEVNTYTERPYTQAVVIDAKVTRVY